MYSYILLISFIFSSSNSASYLWQMVRTRTGDFDLDVPEGSGARHGAAPTEPCGAAPEAKPPLPPPPPPMSIEQLLATQNKLMCVLTGNLMPRGGRQPHHQQVLESSYTDFLMMHPLMFTEASDPLEADNWLRITESKFGLLHYTDVTEPPRGGVH
jgi:hypothetical protein